MRPHILFGMRYLGIQEFEHFAKARIVSNGVPPFGYDQTFKQVLVVIFDTGLDAPEGVVKVFQREVPHCEKIVIYPVKACIQDFSGFCNFSNIGK